MQWAVFGIFLRCFVPHQLHKGAFQLCDARRGDPHQKTALCVSQSMLHHTCVWKAKQEDILGSGHNRDSAKRAVTIDKSYFQT